MRPGEPVKTALPLGDTVAAARVEPAEASAAHWQRENQAALEDSNLFVVRYGLPLARYRLC